MSWLLLTYTKYVSDLTSDLFKVSTLIWRSKWSWCYIELLFLTAVICIDSIQGITQTSLRPGWDPDPVIQLSEASGMPRHLDLLLPGLRLLFLVSWWCIEYCITGDGHLDVSRVSGQYFISAIIFLQLNIKAQNHRKEPKRSCKICAKKKEVCATSHDWFNTERVKKNPAAKHTCSFITLYN